MSNRKKREQRFPRENYGPLLRATNGVLCSTYVLLRKGEAECKTCIVGESEPCFLSRGTAKFCVPHVGTNRPVELRVMNSNCEWTESQDATTIGGLWKVFETEQVITDKIWEDAHGQV